MLTSYPINYWARPEENLMYKRIAPTICILLQVQGNGTADGYRYTHERVTFDREEHLESYLSGLQQSTYQAWLTLFMEYIDKTHVTLEFIDQSNLFTAHYFQPLENLAYKTFGPTSIYLLQLKGKELFSDFTHRHECIVFATEERLNNCIKNLERLDAISWKRLWVNFIDMNKCKLGIIVNEMTGQKEKGVFPIFDEHSF